MICVPTNANCNAGKTIISAVEQQQQQQQQQPFYQQWPFKKQQFLMLSIKTCCTIFTDDAKKALSRIKIQKWPQKRPFSYKFCKTSGNAA
jgi:hypothetical protein